MEGINLDKSITYFYSSFRFFDEGEYHVDRVCGEDVLLLVFSGVLRFTENGTFYELHPGEYHIQKHGSLQEGTLPSDSPKYMYVHFLAEWTSKEKALPKKGVFSYKRLSPLMEKLNSLSHKAAPYIEKAAVFYEILSTLQVPKSEELVANQIAAFIDANLDTNFGLKDLSQKFNYSKNHIINLFKAEYDITPFEYMNFSRIKKSEQLLEITSKSIEDISLECGFNNYSHYFKLFKRINGISPAEWRKKKRLSPLDSPQGRNSL